VMASQIVLDNWVNHVIIGLPYRGIISPMEPDFEGGAASGDIKKISRVSVLVYQTGAMKIGLSLDKLREFFFSDGDILFEKNLLFDTRKSIELESDWGIHNDLYIVQDLPLPQTILGLTYELQCGGLR